MPLKRDVLFPGRGGPVYLLGRVTLDVTLGDSVSEANAAEVDPVPLGGQGERGWAL